MKPYSEEEWRKRLCIYGTVVTLTKIVNGVEKIFILDPEEYEELQDDTHDTSVL